MAGADPCAAAASPCGVHGRDSLYVAIDTVRRCSRITVDPGRYGRRAYMYVYVRMSDPGPGPDCARCTMQARTAFVVERSTIDVVVVVVVNL